MGLLKLSKYIIKKILLILGYKIINKYKEKWAAASILEDYDKETAHKVLEYYFKMQKEGHPLNWFYNNFDVLLDRINDSEKDQELRKERRAQTALLRQEWLNGNA